MNSNDTLENGVTDSIAITFDHEDAIVRVIGEINGYRFAADRYGFTEGTTRVRHTLRETMRFGSDVREFFESIPMD